jgi:hypothetical protein
MLPWIVFVAARMLPPETQEVWARLPTIAREKRRMIAQQGRRSDSVLAPFGTLPGKQASFLEILRRAPPGILRQPL